MTGEKIYFDLIATFKRVEVAYVHIHSPSPAGVYVPGRKKRTGASFSPSPQHRITSYQTSFVSGIRLFATDPHPEPSPS